jgi:hypothetical protein
VFRARAGKVNSSLASLPAEYAAEFARGYSNGRVKIDHGLHPAILTLR